MKQHRYQLLVDSLYINNSGGLRLLMYLTKKLSEYGVDFYLLADARCMGMLDYCKHVRYMVASLWERKKFYRARENQFSAILCFGNIPPPIKMSVPTYTYFHNINLLTLSESHSLMEKMEMWMKRQVFRHYKLNTTYWLVQTSNTAHELCKNLKEPERKVKLMPFYELPEGVNEMAQEKHGDDYVFISNYTGAKGHEELLEAWKRLCQRDIDKVLHLTVPFSNTDFCMKIESAQKEGVKIVNHGFIPFEQVLQLYRQSKAIVYPSHNESLGLGLVEAIEAGCDVIASDLPFTYAVCKPSLVFNPYSSESICNAIIMYENNTTLKSELLISNKIKELVKLLVGGGKNTRIIPLAVEERRAA